IEAGANLGLFTVNGQQCVVTAVATDGGVNIVYSGDRDDTWNTAATDWTSTTFDTGATYVDGMAVTFGPMAGEVAEHTVTLDGTRAPGDVTFKAGTAWTLTGGAFNPTGVVTLEPGAVVTIESTATGSYAVGYGATLSLTNATVTSVRGAGTLNIPAGATVALVSAGAIDSIAALTGEGTLVMPTNTKPGSALQLLLKDAAKWHGTISFVGLTNDNTAGFAMCNYGNDNSTIQFTACTVQYFSQTDNDTGSFKKVDPFNGTTRLVKSYDANDAEVAALTMGSNGFSNYVTQFGKLAGDGKFAANSDHTQIYRFTDATEFTGSISNNSSKGRKFVIGNTTPTSAATITIVSDYAAKLGDGATWEALNGITVSGTLEIAGAGTFSSATTLNGDAVLKFDDIGTAEAPKVLAVNAAVATSAASSDIAIVKIGFGDDIDFGERSSITLATWSSIASNISFSFVDETMEYEWSLVPDETSLVMKKNPEIKNDKGETVGYMMSTAAVVLDTSADVILPEGSVVNTVQLFGMDVPTLVVKGAALNVALIIALDADGNQDGSMVMTGFTVTPDAQNSTTTISLNSPAVASAPVTVSEVVYPPMSMSESAAPVFAVSS
ncbi:MAG: hypothetical protein IKO43_06450, partial [Kiritimatiellae bacterium]|nr:hypothetical protein [Kiritimatiellia bacterium]